jgi:iron(III) transport system substrate-binding protein
VALHYFKGKDPGAFVSVSGGAVLKTAPHKAQAEAFLKWIAGPDGQAVLRDGTSFEYAVGNGAASNAALPPLDSLEAPTVDPGLLNSKKVSELMTEAGLL